MFAKLKGAHDDKLLMNKCEHNCGRYVHDKKPVCCSKCNGLSGKHSSRCQSENKSNDITIKICIKDFYDEASYIGRLFLDICTFKNISTRLLNKLKALIEHNFKKSITRIIVGCQNDIMLKPEERLHSGTSVFIKGSVVDYRKKLFEFLENFIKANSLEDYSYKFDDIVTDSNHVLLDLRTTSLRSQLYILYHLEEGDFSYKINFIDLKEWDKY